jgi:hypothetical protein
LTCVGSRHSIQEAIQERRDARNGKSVVAQEANVTAGFGAEIPARLHELSENGAPLKIERVGTLTHPSHAQLVLRASAQH